MSASQDNNRQYFNQDVEPLLNTPQMKLMQEDRLKSVLQYFYDNVPFDRERMDLAGITPESIKSLDDLARRLPFAGKQTSERPLSV